MAPIATIPLVHLVGSIPLDSIDGVLTTVPKQLPGRLRRISDGEVGERKDFCAWQMPKLPPKIYSSQIKPTDPNSESYDATQKTVAAAATDITLADFLPTGYDNAAIASYARFKKHRDEGTIPTGTRFQVSLPTPLNTMAFFVDPVYVSRGEELYRERIFEAVRNIQAAIPSEDLAIQWDMPTEMAHMEHAYGPKREGFVALPPQFAPVREGIVERMGLLAAAVDPAVPMGFHLCYGDFNRQHFVQPADTRMMVALFNALHAHITSKRPINWVHVPVPKDRTDPEYFRPLRDLKLDADGELILGLVYADDLHGTQKRVAAASSALGDTRRFGVSTVCGIGRAPRSELDSIFDICREVTPSE